MNKFICFLSRAHGLHLLLLLLLLLLLMLLIALMADITMLLEIPMKVRKSRTPPWGLPHWLLLQKYLLFQLSLSIFVFVPQSGVIVSCQDPERNDDSEEPDWDHLTTDNMLSDNCGLTLLLSSVHTTLHTPHSTTFTCLHPVQTWWSPAQQREPAGAGTAARRASWWTTWRQWSPSLRYWSVVSW